ncbi:MAG: hypothetical protein JWP89_3203 [Schlesneria sp.]|nr:hypothetical protein [Schlesneria sp.]
MSRHFAGLQRSNLCLAVRWQRFTPTQLEYVSFRRVSGMPGLKIRMVLSITLRVRSSTEITIRSHFLAA